MKLTQKTIFQCFDKSQKLSPIILDDTDEEIFECEVPLKSSTNQSESLISHQPDFLLPIHIRQENLSSETNILPLLNQWKLIDFNDDISSNYPSNFSRIDSINHHEEISSRTFQINSFIPIKSIEYQMELFQKYTTDDLSSYAQSIIDWKVMFQYLQDYRNKAIEQNQYEQLPWTEIYRPRHSKTYLGSHKKSIHRLNQWFTYWTKKLMNEQPNKSIRKGRKRRNNDDNSDEDFIDDSNLFNYNRYQTKQQEHPQIIYIHGLGTTSLVHALAEEHHFKITEINGSQCRTRTSLIKQLEQMTSHHYLSLKRCTSDTNLSQTSQSLSNVPMRKKAKNERGTIMSFFNNNTKKSDSTNEIRRRSKRTKKKENEPIPAPSSSVQVEKTSLILFDEIDTLTIDDHFWSCLKKLLETAKKPIVLTSNSRSNPDDAIFNLSKIGNYEMIHLESNEPEIIYCFLRLILLVEMLEIPSINDLIHLFQSCTCDLRRTLLTLQFLAQSSSSSTISNQSSMEILSNNNSTKFPSSNIFDTIFYSYLHEQWEESLLKSLFNDLTRKYTNEYESSINKYNSNDSKRIELYDTLKMFLQEQDIDTITNHSSINLDYRSYIRQICQNEQIRASESNSTRRLRHSLSFRGCSLQWSDFSILSHGLD